VSIDLLDRQTDWSAEEIEEAEEERPDDGAEQLQLDDSLLIYVRDVNRVPRLSPAEELALFRRLEAGDMAAKRRLIEANLRLVIWIARRYAVNGVPLLDLIQEGNLALGTAVEKFDYRLGYRLSTYASLWIRQAIERASVRYARVVPIPHQVWREMAAVRRSRQRLRQRLRREPLVQELAQDVGLDVRRVNNLLAYDQPSVSLEEGSLFGDGIGELIEDVGARRPEVAVDEGMRTREIASALRRIDGRLRLVLELRFGLNGEPPCSLEEVGRRIGISKERVRQLEVRALERLRRSAPNLRAYLEAA